jgi:hypothetical protein
MLFKFLNSISDCFKKSSQTVSRKEVNSICRVDRFFLLIGQSNMSGRGLPATYQEKSDDGVFVFCSKQNQWQHARDPLQPINDPIFSVNADRVGGIGPSVTFAKTLSDRLAENIGIVLCAKGGTGIASWDSSGEMYREAVRRVSIASKSSRIVGICIYVGESDTASEANALLWASRFENLVNNLRNDLGADLPVVFAQLASISSSRRAFKEHGYVAWELLKKIQENLILSRCAMVKTEDLSLNEDGLHLDGIAQRELGRRFAGAMLSLLNDVNHGNNRSDS